MLVDEGRGLAAAGARHVLDHDARLAGDVPRQMPRECARIDVVAAAGIAADDEFDGFAGEEILRGGGGGHECREDGGERDPTRVDTRH